MAADCRRNSLTPHNPRGGLECEVTHRRQAHACPRAPLPGAGPRGWPRLRSDGAVLGSKHSRSPSDCAQSNGAAGAQANTRPRSAPGCERFTGAALTGAAHSPKGNTGRLSGGNHPSREPSLYIAKPRSAALARMRYPSRCLTRGSSVLASAAPTRLVLANLLLGELADIRVGLIGEIPAQAVDVALIGLRDRPSRPIMEAHGVPGGQGLLAPGASA